MLFEMMGVPGVIDEAKKRKGSARRKANENEAPTAVRTVTMLLDVTDDRFTLPLMSVFPGVDVVSNAMGNREEYPAGKMTMARKLPNLSIVCTDVEGDVIFTAENVKVLNKPELRIASGAQAIEMPVKVRVSIPRDGVQKLDDAVGPDLLFNVKANQTDIDDVIEPSENAGKSKQKGSSKSKTTVPIDGAVN